MSSSDTLPNNIKGYCASTRAAPFPYQFPRSRRWLGGKFSVEEAAGILQKFYTCHRILMRTLAGWLIQVPEFEVKVELAHHLYMHAEAIRMLRGRLIELRIPQTQIEAQMDSDCGILGTELLHAHNPAELIAVTHSVVARYLLTAEKQHMELTDKLADLPTIRILRHIQIDLEEMCQWGEATLQAYFDGGYDECSVRVWQEHVESVLNSLGGITGGQPCCQRPPLRQETEPPFKRKIDCERDERFTTFHHTRDYRKADDFDSQMYTAYERECLEMIRVQRDEIDAIETFANVLYDLSDASFDLEMDLARFIWDEARHAEIGHQSLTRLGFDPFEVPCGIIGIKVRSPLPPELAFAQINIFGELNIVGSMHRLSHWAYKKGDRDTGITFDFIHADELIHLQKGRVWLRKLHPTDQLSTIQEKARVAAIQRLLEEGVIGEDYAMNLTAKEIGKLIGE